MQQLQPNNSQYCNNLESNKQQNKTTTLTLKKCCLRQGCEDIDNYKRLNKIHEGEYGVVYRALEIPTDKIYAVKKLKLREGTDFPITSLRQISILRSLDHQNIIKITRVAGNRSKNSYQDKVYIVMQYLDHEIKQLLKVLTFTQPQIRRLMTDLLNGIAYLHERNIIHRDLKTSNLLYSNEGILKICDFGLARKAIKALMTQQVITMWYRPPQLLLGQYHYSTELDIWSVGCIMGQLFKRQPMFQGKSQIEQLDTIFKVIGSPYIQNWPDLKLFKNYPYVQGRKYPNSKLKQYITGISQLGLDLLKSLLTANPRQRITAKKALSHPWFKQQITLRQQMPRYTPINQLDRLKKKIKVQQ